MTGNDQQRQELIDRFSLNRVVKSPSVFDMAKLRWVNGQVRAPARSVNLSVGASLSEGSSEPNHSFPSSPPNPQSTTTQPNPTDPFTPPLLLFLPPNNPLTQHLRAMPDAELVPLVAARLEADGLAKAGAEGAAFVAFATQVAKGSMELVNDATKIVGDVLTYPVRVCWCVCWPAGPPWTGQSGEGKRSKSSTRDEIS